MKRIKQVIMGLLVMTLLAAVCSGKGAEEMSYEGALKFSGLPNEFSVPYNDIYAMPSVTAEMKHISSSGEVFNQTVTGVKLEDVLALHGASKQGMSSIRFTAGDGYAMTMPAEIFESKDIILAWAFDGEVLEEKKMPLRVAVNDERSMYYVSNLVEVAFEQSSEAAEAPASSTVVLMESAFTTLETEDYMYYDSNDKAVNAKALMKAFTSTKGDAIEFVASDGYEKTETYDVVKEGFIKINGEDAPLFTGRDLPKGMNVKYILKMAVADAVYVSANSALESVETVSFENETGVKLDALVEMAGLEADTYKITATDGYAKEVARETLELGMAYVNSDGAVNIMFDDGNSKRSKIKNAVTIEAASGAKPSEEAVAEVSEATSWVITFEGLSDGSFDFDSGRAERKLDKVAVHTERMKNDVKKPEDWEGYRVLDILAWLKVEDFSSLTIVASDGYEAEIVREMIDDESILAVVKNGEAMTDEDNKVQFVQNTEFATTWVKGVAKVIVK